MDTALSGAKSAADAPQPAGEGKGLFVLLFHRLLVPVLPIWLHIFARFMLHRGSLCAGASSECFA